MDFLKNRRPFPQPSRIALYPRQPLGGPGALLQCVLAPLGPCGEQPLTRPNHSLKFHTSFLSDRILFPSYQCRSLLSTPTPKHCLHIRASHDPYRAHATQPAPVTTTTTTTTRTITTRIIQLAKITGLVPHSATHTSITV